MYFKLIAYFFFILPSFALASTFSDSIYYFELESAGVPWHDIITIPAEFDGWYITSINIYYSQNVSTSTGLTFVEYGTNPTYCATVVNSVSSAQCLASDKVSQGDKIRLYNDSGLHVNVIVNLSHPFIFGDYSATTTFVESDYQTISFMTASDFNDGMLWSFWWLFAMFLGLVVPALFITRWVAKI